MLGPKPSALPLGDSPICENYTTKMEKWEENVAGKATEREAVAARIIIAWI